jgi:uncharacterized protein
LFNVVAHLEPSEMDTCWEDPILRGDTEVLRDLLSRGIHPDARDRHGQTGLMLTAQGGHLTAVQLLIDHGANLNMTAKFGLSAVMLAVIAGHKEIARVLARAGADLGLRGTGAPGFAGKTAADLAAERGMNDLAVELTANSQG